jgi:hypothetical protein
MAVMLLIVAVGLLYRPVLRTAAGALVVDDPWNGSGDVLIIDGDRCYERAAEILRRSASSRALLIERRPERVVRMGIVRSTGDVGRRELAREGIKESSIDVAPGQAGSDWQLVRILGRWLADHHDTHVVVLCRRFSGRVLQRLVDHLLEPSIAARVHVRGLPDEFENETNWWTTRNGIKCVFGAYLRYGYTIAFGENTLDLEDWNPDEYERSLR